MIPPFKQINTNDYYLETVQSNVSSTLNQVVNKSILDGQLLTGISLQTGLNRISHKLNRNYNGWIVVSLNAASTIYEVQDSTSALSTTLQLHASAPATISLWVF